MTTVPKKKKKKEKNDPLDSLKKSTQTTLFNFHLQSVQFNKNQPDSCKFSLTIGPDNGEKLLYFSSVHIKSFLIKFLTTLLLLGRFVKRWTTKHTHF